MKSETSTFEDAQIWAESTASHAHSNWMYVHLCKQDVQ